MVAALGEEQLMDQRVCQRSQATVSDPNEKHDLSVNDQAEQQSSLELLRPPHP